MRRGDGGIWRGGGEGGRQIAICNLNLRAAHTARERKTGSQINGREEAVQEKEKRREDEGEGEKIDRKRGRGLGGPRG